MNYFGAWSEVVAAVFDHPPRPPPHVPTTFEQAWRLVFSPPHLPVGTVRIGNVSSICWSKDHPENHIFENML